MARASPSAARLTLATLAAGIAMLSATPRFEQTLIVERGLSLAQAHAGAWLLIAIAAWSAGSLLWFGRRRSPQALATMLAGIWVLYGLVAYPLLTDSSSARGLMLQAGATHARRRSNSVLSRGRNRTC